MGSAVLGDKEGKSLMSVAEGSLEKDVVGDDAGLLLGKIEVGDADWE